MLECSQCGHENLDEARFCNSCGAALPDHVSVGARKTVTVVFCDLVGSTALGEGMDPEVLRELLARYHGELRRIIERHGGTVEKFVGDAAMAVFGAPQVHEDDALRAVRAAAEMREAVVPQGLQVKIGVNTGEVMAGPGETLITGDAVNVAARLEQAAGAGQILIGQTTAQLTGGAVRVEPVEPLSLKGKSEPVPAFHLREVVVEAPAIHRRVDTPLVGREGELAELRAALTAAIEQRTPRLATIVGPAGIGKSRLAHELLSSSQARVLIGRCLSYGEGITYWPLAELLAQIDDLDEVMAHGDGDPAQVRLRVTASVEAADAAVPPEEIAWGFRKLFESLARERPTIVVLDDIHWAEPPLLDLIASIARLATDAPLLVLCTARPELLELRPGWTTISADATVVALEALSGEDAERLVEKLGPADEATKRRILETAEGNPLFVEQLMAFQAESGDVQIPATLQAVLMARIDRLADEERAVVACGSVEGRLFHRGAVTELLPDRARPKVGPTLLTLVHKDLIRPGSASVPGDDGFRFGHILIRDAAYQAIPKRRRAELHEQYANWLMARLGDLAPGEIVGYHLEQSYRYGVELGAQDRALGLRAAELLSEAARRARSRVDIAATINLLARAHELAGEGTFQRGLRVALGATLYAAGEFARAQEALETAVAEARGADDPHSEWLARLHLAMLRVRREPEGAAELAMSEAQEAMATCGPAEDHEVLGHAWRALAEAHLLRSQAMEQAKALERARQHAQKAGDRLLEVESIISSVPPILFGPVPVQDGLRLADEVCQRLGDAPIGQGFALHVQGHMMARLGQFDGALEAITQWRDRFRELGQEFLYANTSACVWDVCSWAGEWGIGEQALREGYEFLEQAGEKAFLSTLAAQMGEALCHQERLDEAEHFAEISQRLGASDDQVNEISWRLVRSAVWVRRGEHARADALAREAADLASGTDYLELEARTWLVLAEVRRAAGAEAREPSERALALYERKGNLVGAERARSVLA